MSHKIIAVLCVFFLMVSCKNANEDMQMVSINNSWKQEKALDYHFDVKDAQNPKNIIFVVRNNNSYPYSNLRLFVTLKNEKTKKSTVDTVNFVLAKPSGEWIGKGYGETKETSFPFRSDYKFPENGKYTFSVKQAMRNSDLIGLEDLGIKLQSQN